MIGNQVDDVDGYPTVRGERLNHDAEETWTVTLTPSGLLMEGPERTATVPLGVLFAVRQRPATAVDDRTAARFEVEWVTSLGEERKLALRSDDVGAVQRMCRVVEASLRDLDEERKRNRRFLDWPLATFLVMGLALAVTRAVTAQAPTTTYDWVATITNFLFSAFTVPLLYVTSRAAVRAWRRRRPA